MGGEYKKKIKCCCFPRNLVDCFHAQHLKRSREKGRRELWRKEGEGYERKERRGKGRGRKEKKGQADGV